jgi:hypothetical protein
MHPAHQYRACGLTIASEIVIPGLPSVEQAQTPDLRVSVGTRTRGTLGEERLRYASPERYVDGTAQLTVWTGSTGAHRLRYHDGTEFVVDRPATRVEVHWEPPLTDADAAVYLLGPVLGFVMRLRGVIPLHASGVMIGGRAVAFAGDAWAGKSSTAAAFAALGHQVLSDDLLPIVRTADGVLAYPSHPRLTMWPDAARALFGQIEELPSLTPTYDKRYLDLHGADRFRDTPVPLEVIYVLGERTNANVALQIDTLRPQAALMSLVSNTYGNYLLDGPMRATEFDVLSRVVQEIPVRRVSFGDDIAQLLSSCRTLAGERLLEVERSL